MEERLPRFKCSDETKNFVCAAEGFGKPKRECVPKAWLCDGDNVRLLSCLSLAIEDEGFGWVA